MTLRTTLIAAAGAALVFAGVIAANGAPAPAPVDKAAVEKIVHDYLMAHPEILFDMQNELSARQDAADDKARNDALAKLGRGALTDPKVAYVAGPANAKVTVAEFFDYRCVHCKASLAGMRKAIEGGGANVRFAFIEFPILTADSVVAAKAAIAARRQPGKYVPFHLALMATAGDLPKERILSIAKSVGLDVAKLEKDMDDPAVTASIDAAHALAQKLHVDGTPTFVINNKFWVGELTDAKLQEMIKAAG